MVGWSDGLWKDDKTNKVGPLLLVVINGVIGPLKSRVK